MDEPAVLALGGGAVTIPEVRTALRGSALTVLLDVEVETAWQRTRGGDRPLARDEAEFRSLYEERRPVYDAVADARADDVDDVVLAAGGVHVELGALERLGELVPGDGSVELVADARVAGIHGMDAQLALGARAQALHEVGPGERAKTADSLESLWQMLRLERGGTLLALGGGSTTDVAGFAAATYLRGIDWVAVPTTLVAQVDAGIGGKTAIDLPYAKNLVGAFHWPLRTVIDPALLETLPEAELANGRAEVVKTGLLAGEPLWELPLPEQIRRAAAFKTAVCLRDPRTAASGRSSTSATPSRTRSRRRRATSCRTGAPSRSACSPRCVSPASTPASSSTSCARSPSGRPRARVVGAHAGQEGRRRRPASRPARGARPAANRGRAARGGGASRARCADRGLESPPCGWWCSTGSISTCSAGAIRSSTAGSRSTSWRAGSTTGRRSSSARPAAGRRITKASTSTGATTLSTGRTASSSTPGRGRTTAMRSGTRSSSSPFPSSRCTCPTSRNARTGGDIR